MIDACVVDPAFAALGIFLGYACLARKGLIVFSNHSILIGMEFGAFSGTINGACGDFYLASRNGLTIRKA